MNLMGGGLNVKVGTQQEIETLINEESLLLAKYLRGERKDWNPRLVNIGLS